MGSHLLRARTRGILLSSLCTMLSCAGPPQEAVLLSDVKILPFTRPAELHVRYDTPGNRPDTVILPAKEVVETIGTRVAYERLSRVRDGFEAWLLTDNYAGVFPSTSVREYVLITCSPPRVTTLVTRNGRSYLRHTDRSRAPTSPIEAGVPSGMLYSRLCN